MIVVVGGQARKVGKTRAVCDIVAATPWANWIAYKVSPHEHDDIGPNTDTSRYLAAGASDAGLVKALPHLPPNRNIIIESNSAAELLRPDLFVFVTDASQAEWKDSAVRTVNRANYVVNGRITSEVIAAVTELLRLSNDNRGT